MGFNKRSSQESAPLAPPPVAIASASDAELDAKDDYLEEEKRKKGLRKTLLSERGRPSLGGDGGSQKVGMGNSLRRTLG